MSPPEMILGLGIQVWDSCSLKNVKPETIDLWKNFNRANHVLEYTGSYLDGSWGDGLITLRVVRKHYWIELDKETFIRDAKGFKGNTYVSIFPDALYLIVSFIKSGCMKTDQSSIINFTIHILKMNLYRLDPIVKLK